MSFRELRQKILEVFENMQERFRNTKPTIALIDALAITNQGYSYIQEDLEKQEKQLREIRREKEHWNKNFEGGHEFNKGQIHIINRILGVDSDKKESMK